MQLISSFANNDRVANYGDGLFTTMAVKQGRIALFRYHLARLLHDGARLGLTLNERDILSVIQQQMPQGYSGVLKVLISAGEGGRGYARDEAVAPNICVSQHHSPSFYDEWKQQGIGLRVSYVKLAQQPLLAGLKHANRLEQVLVKQGLAKYQEHDALVLDSQGFIVEASAANVFWLKKGEWFTPSLAFAGVAGVMRAYFLDWAEKQAIKVSVGQYSLAALEGATAMFTCNALMGLMPVKYLINEEQRYAFDLAPVSQLNTQFSVDIQDEDEVFTG